MDKKLKCSDCEKQVSELCPSCWKCEDCCTCIDRKNQYLKSIGRRKMLK